MLKVIEMSWTLLLLLPQVGGGINLSPKSGFFPRGSNITLICTAKDASYVLWTEKETTETIFVNKEKISKNEKYANFHISSQSPDDYSLEISHADVSDDGTYVCQGHSNSTEATIVIEAKPTLSIHIDGNEGFDHTSLTSSRHSIRISCLAKGAKPAVFLKLKINDSDWMQPVDHNITKYADLYESYIKSGIVELRATSSITCHASGQQSIADFNHTEIIYAPICNISKDTTTIKCSCTANPPVFKSTFLVNGLEKHTNTLKFRNYIPADFTCSGANYVGNGSSTIFIGTASEQGKRRKLLYAVIAIVVVFVVPVSLVAIFCWSQRRKGYSGVKTEHEEINEIYELLPKLAAKVTCDWEIFALDDLKLPENDVIAIVKSTNDFQGQIQAAFETWLIYNDGQPLETLKRMLIDIWQKSTVCSQNKFDIFPEKSTDGTDTRTSQCKDITETNTKCLYKELVESGCERKFSLLLNNISERVGEVGVENLQKHYSANGEHKTITTSAVFFKHLLDTKQVRDTIDSLNQLCKALKESRLFSAQNLVLNNIKRRSSMFWKFRLIFVTLYGLPRTNEKNESKTNF